MSLAQVLPKPKQISSKWNLSDDESDGDLKSKPKLSSIPKYPHRSKWVPQTEKDFGGGGAYPECHIVQYPLGMGRKDVSKVGHQHALALQTDKDGNIQYDMVLRKGSKVVHSSLAETRERGIQSKRLTYYKDFDSVELLPDEDEIEKVTEKTKEALEKLVDRKIKSNKPKELGVSQNGPTYVKYVPAENQHKTDAAASSRIIRLTEAPVDPMEPSRFKHRKVPRPPGSPPPPVLRSPPRKVSAEEQKNWVIPPCISNWKNAKGYTIPLDKRLANDGRGLQDVTINDNFAKLSEALFIADRHAREEVQLRAEMQTKLAQKQKKEKEERLRELAQKAREERNAAVASESRRVERESSSEEEEESSEEEDEDEKLTEEEKRALKARQELRREKAKERERLLRQQQAKGAKTAGERDISEKIALGTAQPTMSQESMYDQRLFNQTSGLTSGFGSSSSYNLYDKPLFNATAQSIYKPTRGGEEENAVAGVGADQFASLLAKGPHKKFAGTDLVDGASRSGPVQFEKEEDVFGVDAFMSAAKRGRGKEEEDERDAQKKSRK